MEAACIIGTFTLIFMEAACIIGTFTLSIRGPSPVLPTLFFLSVSSRPLYRRAFIGADSSVSLSVSTRPLYRRAFTGADSFVSCAHFRMSLTSKVLEQC
jgi:hypothetical protein